MSTLLSMPFARSTRADGSTRARASRGSRPPRPSRGAPSRRATRPPPPRTPAVSAPAAALEVGQRLRDHARQQGGRHETTTSAKRGGRSRRRLTGPDAVMANVTAAQPADSALARPSCLTPSSRWRRLSTRARRAGGEHRQAGGARDTAPARSCAGERHAVTRASRSSEQQGEKERGRSVHKEVRGRQARRRRTRQRGGERHVTYWTALARRGRAIERPPPAWPSPTRRRRR